MVYIILLKNYVFLALLSAKEHNYLAIIEY